ncbi:hypothetical protein NUW54_g5184 [Trametes sanguinea]|uniref:Uncharacterized protein n=1 Tax=Trametes sanguinea TaxID=158606 RepID=A0ACC1PVV2_9APHY|nr:hypothetical protein NUW54_g5184 [Trametes sanguinea]
MLEIRTQNQSKTSTRSERIIAIDPKFALSRLLDPTKQLSIKHASHHLRVVQALTVGGKIGKTTREHRWQETVKSVRTVVPQELLPNLPSKNVNTINPLRPGCLVIMRNKVRMYVGEVLDLYKPVSRRHGSIDSATSAAGLSYLSLRVYLPLTLNTAPSDGEEASSEDEHYAEADEAPLFSCRYNSVDIFTHAFADHLLYNLGPNAMTGTPVQSRLKPFAVTRWLALSKATEKIAQKEKSIQKQAGKKAGRA